MDIHRPKAAHSIREFLIEIGTIICGILIALGLEQVQEQLHARHETEQVDKALSLEVRRNLSEAIQRATTYYCQRAQIALAVRKLTESADWPGGEVFTSAPPAEAWSRAIVVRPGIADASVPTGVPTPIETNFGPGSPIASLLSVPRATISSRSWSSAAASSGLLHMERRRLNRFAVLYREGEDIERAIEEEQTNRAALTPLLTARRLDQTERDHYVEILAQLNRTNQNLYARAGLMVATAARNGIHADERDVTERTKALNPTYASCIKPFVLPGYTTRWVDKLEGDRDRVEPNPPGRRES